MKEVTISQTTIKGYHIFKIKPSQGVMMVVERDRENRYDRWALNVKLDDKMVGRVPANMCRIFSELLDGRSIEKICCFADGAPMLSKTVDPQTSFRSYKSRKDREGGGAVIPCKYVLHCYESCHEDVLERLKKSFSLPELEGPVVH